MSAATILTLANGRGIDLLHPKASDVDFDSYAEQLTKEKRFNGATPGVEYSVGEHLSRGIDAIMQATKDPVLAGYFSVHDGPEAVLKDDTTPKKHAIAEICQQEFGILAEQVLASMKKLEDRHDVVIHAAAGLQWPMPQQLVTAVKRWDLIMFTTEWRDLMGNRPHPNPVPYAGIEPLRDVIVPWRWETAKTALLNRWRALLPALRTLAHDKTRSEHGGASV